MRRKISKKLVTLFGYVLLLVNFKSEGVFGKDPKNQVKFVCDEQILATQAKWLTGGQSENVIFWRNQSWIDKDSTTLRRKCIDVSSAFQKAYQEGYLKRIISIEGADGRGIICASRDNKRCDRSLYKLLPGESRIDIAKQLFNRIIGNAPSLVQGDFSFDIERFLFGGRITFSKQTLCPIQKVAKSLQISSDVSVKAFSVLNSLQQFTVRIDAMESQGSGVIVAREGNVYCVLTARHNIKTSFDINRSIRLVTHDGERYTAQNPRVAAANIDLAMLEFVSNKNYVVASIGQLEQSSLEPKATIHIAGFPASFLRESTTAFIYKGSLDDYNKKRFDITYTRSYSEEPLTFGVSGGPVISSQGLLIGIHGEGESIGAKSTILKGVLIDADILSKMALSLGIKQDIVGIPPIVTSPKPISKPVDSTPSPLITLEPSDPQTILLRTGNKCPGCDLSGKDFRSTELNRADFYKANLRGTNLFYAVLSEANLSESDLSRADLSHTNLNNANLQGANLQSADLRSADLRGANLQNANLQNANLFYANLSGADLRGANFQNVDLEYADLRNTKKERAIFKDAKLGNAKW
jgi:Pentapeptide repeats (8 copies)/Trypsin-like peptidase domain/Circadian oscillating protein COP23